MNVQENGGFELDDDINDYLPFSIFIPDYPDSIITFRELLTHTSSFKDNWNILDTIYVHGDSPTSLGDFMKGYFKEGGVNYDANKNFYSVPPGTHYHYCNEGAALCGYLVELITGIPFDQYCNDSIFKPLCMDQTSWFLSGLDSNTIAMPYEWPVCRPEREPGIWQEAWFSKRCSE
jgi:CubicO group peptidase (beta-lactamase class C family)